MLIALKIPQHPHLQNDVKIQWTFQKVHSRLIPPQLLSPLPTILSLTSVSLCGSCSHFLFSPLHSDTVFNPWLLSQSCKLHTRIPETGPPQTPRSTPTAYWDAELMMLYWEDQPRVCKAMQSTKNRSLSWSPQRWWSETETLPKYPSPHVCINYVNQSVHWPLLYDNEEEWVIIIVFFVDVCSLCMPKILQHCFYSDTCQTKSPSLDGRLGLAKEKRTPPRTVETKANCSVPYSSQLSRSCHTCKCRLSWRDC